MSANSQRRITPEEIARVPAPGTSLPARFQFQPKGRLLTYLHDPEGGVARSLWALDIDTHEKRRVDVDALADERDLTLEEQLRRERQRAVGTGVTTYDWSQDGRWLVVPGPAGVTLVDALTWQSERWVEGPVIDPQLSPDGSLLAFVRDGEVWVAGPAGERRLTTAPDEGVTNGLAEYVAQEEMGRLRGFWWSPDSRHIAYEEVDERDVTVHTIAYTNRFGMEHHRYPRAGDRNARVALHVIAADGSGEPVTLELAAAAPGGGSSEHDWYLARVDWTSSGEVAVQLTDRAQTELRLVVFDIPTGAHRELLTEVSHPWLNLHDALRFLDDGRFVWASERSGFRHLELRAVDGSLLRELTGGEWVVDAVLDVNHEQVVFCGNREHPTQRDVYAVRLDDPAQQTRLSAGHGWSDAVVSLDAAHCVIVHSSVQSKPVITLRALDGGAEHVIHTSSDPRVAALALVPPRLAEFSVDGDVLHAALYVPEGTGPFPTLVSVYGGPHAQRVMDTWGLTADLRAQAYREMGFLVLVVDNRGSARRGLRFEGHLHRSMGTIEVEDQAAGVQWAAESGWADPGRVGIYGWSYGGYMSIMCLARRPDVFHAALAGAPVSDWALYDTHYTERYMGTPANNPEGYAASDAGTHAHAIGGRLLLVHGLLDENVHFGHTGHLIDALTRAGREYELVVFPEGRHSTRNEHDRVYLNRRSEAFFTRALEVPATSAQAVGDRA